MRSFKQAQKHIFVDQAALDKSIAFLNTQKRENGEFGEQGTVHHKDMQGGASQGGVPMTAYVTLSLLENNVCFNLTHICHYNNIYSGTSKRVNKLFGEIIVESVR
jgi:hypothetical protein